MKLVKTSGIPVWITIVVGLLVLMGGIVGPLAMAGQGFESFMTPAWGGRSFGLSVFAAAAILLKDHRVYLAMFIASIAREVGDLIQLSQAETMNWGLGAPTIILPIVWILGAYYSAKPRRMVKPNSVM